MKQSWLEPHVEMPLLLGSVLSSDGITQVRDANPLLNEGTCQELIDRAAVLMLRTSRISQLRRTLHEIKSTFPFVVTGHSNAEISTSIGSICQNIFSQRYYTKICKDGSIQFDPRFLSFEFVSGYMLWERQANLVKDFYNAAINGSSETQQMIMGDGKTTVVGPMLTLMLGGQRGVTVVCPKALIAQTNSIMRQIFSAPLNPKPVLTLKFDRGHDSRVSSLRAVREKLEGAHNELGIVIASPTSIKSYFLKYIELLVMLKANRDGGRKTKKDFKKRGKLKQPPQIQSHQQNLLMDITVPQGGYGGQIILVAAPSGQQFQVQIPRGLVSGQQFRIQVADNTTNSGGETKTNHEDIIQNPTAKWYQGPLTWRTGKVPICKIIKRPDISLSFVSSRVCVIPAPSSKMVLEIAENGPMPYRFPKGTVVESAWYVNRHDTYGLNDPLFTDRIREGEEGGNCRNVTSILQHWFDTGEEHWTIGNSDFGDPCYGKEKSLLLTVYWPKELNVRQLALDSECYAIIPNEEFLNEHSKLKFPLTRLPEIGSYQLVYLRGSPNSYKPDITVTEEQYSSMGGHRCSVYGEAVDISVTSYTTDSDEYLDEGSILGYVGPAGYGSQIFDQERGYALIYRNEQPTNTQGFDTLQNRKKTMLQKITRLDMNYTPDRHYVGCKNGDEQIFLGCVRGEGWTSQRVGGLDQSSDSEPSSWYFVPSRRGNNLMRIEAYWTNNKRCHLGAGGPSNAKRGHHHETQWHPSMIPLMTEDERELPISEQHVWKIVLDEQGSDKTGRRCWHLVYQGPTEQCIGWILSFSPFDHEWAFLGNPNIKQSRRFGMSRGRNLYGRYSPSSFEIMESGFSLDWRAPIRESNTLSKKHLVRLDLPLPHSRSRSFASDINRFERDLSKKKKRTNGSPFYLKYTNICSDKCIGPNKKESCTRCELCCRIIGTFVEVHFCKGTSMKSSVRSYRVSSDVHFEIHRRVHIADPSKVVKYIENDTHFIVLIAGGFPRGQEGHADVQIRGVLNIGAPPPGGNVLICIEKDTIGGINIPKPLAKVRNKNTITINCNLGKGEFSHIDTYHTTENFTGKPWVLSENNHWNIWDVHGYIEYSFTLPEDAIIDIGCNYFHDRDREMVLFLNDTLIDRHFTSRCQAIEGQTADPLCMGTFKNSNILVYSEVGPHIAKKGHNVIRIESTWMFAMPGQARFGLVNRLESIQIDWLPLSKTKEYKNGIPSISLSAKSFTGAAASFVSTTTTTSKKLDMNTALRLLPDAFGISGAVAFQPASNSSSNCLLGLPKVNWYNPREILGSNEDENKDDTSANRFGPDNGFAKVKTALEIATSSTKDDGTALWCMDYEKGDPSRPKNMMVNTGDSHRSSVGSKSSGGGSSNGDNESVSPPYDWVMKGILPGQPVILNEVPSSILQTLNKGGKRNKLETCVSGIYLSSREGHNSETAFKIQHIRFDYASGRSRSHGCYRGREGGPDHFIGYFAVPYGTYLSKICFSF
jgi:hypothetical protein